MDFHYILNSPRIFNIITTYIVNVESTLNQKTRARLACVSNMIFAILCLKPI